MTAFKVSSKTSVGAFFYRDNASAIKVAVMILKPNLNNITEWHILNDNFLHTTPLFVAVYHPNTSGKVSFVYNGRQDYTVQVLVDVGIGAGTAFVVPPSKIYRPKVVNN